MRKFILSLPARLQVIFVPASVIILAFTIASLFGKLFDEQQLQANADLISSVYEVMGTIYAILLTFTLWGVWQNYTKAETAVQQEAYAILDLIHVIEASPRWESMRLRETVLSYLEGVVSCEWGYLKDMKSQIMHLRERSHHASMKIVQVVQGITPEGSRETAIFSQALILLDNWLDARRTRILMAYGNTAKSLWPLLVTGAFVLFAFHGLFVAQTLGIWITLLAGTSLVIGLTFYLIFTLDCPFTGTPSIDSEPFQLALNILENPTKSVHAESGAMLA